MCENLLIRRALEQPVWGWGGYERSRAYFDEAKTSLVQMDGLWVITLGTRGFIGLGLLYLVLELPVIVFLVRFPCTTLEPPPSGPGRSCGHVAWPIYD